MASRTQPKAPSKDGSQSAHTNTDEDIVESYADLLNELRLLTTVSVLLFGFLLAVARTDLGDTEQWLLLAAILFVASATVQFVLPTVYHRLQYPYVDWDKFQRRVHGFINVGLPMLAAGFYLSLVIAAWDQFDELAFAIALIPPGVAGITYASRRFLAHED